MTGAVSPDDGDEDLEALVDEEFARIRALLAAADLSVPITSSRTAADGSDTPAAAKPARASSLTNVR